MKPRDPQRIERMLAVLREVWMQVPDWRLGQIIVNAANPPVEEPCSHVFFLEDREMEKLLAKLREVMGQAGPPSTSA